jgi:hypothetical protein
MLATKAVDEAEILFVCASGCVDHGQNASLERGWQRRPSVENVLQVVAD